MRPTTLMAHDDRQRGFLMTELLVALLVTSVLVAGVVGAFSAQLHAYAREEAFAAREDNLRMAMITVTRALRTAGYGVPRKNLATWIPWVSGFSSNPKLDASGSRLSVAGCFEGTLETLSANALITATTLSVTSAAGLDTNRKRLIQLGETPLWVTGAANVLGQTTITIDANPSTTGPQGLPRAYPAGTPLCRVDVRTFSIGTESATGMPRLLRDQNHGTGAQPIAEGIKGFQVTSLGGNQFEITITARTERRLPGSGNYAERALRSKVRYRNG
ncbi:MAG: PilW family protein [Candidatus Binatia bacterium]